VDRLSTWLWSTTHASNRADAPSGTARHTRAWSVGIPAIVANCRRLRFVPQPRQMTRPDLRLIALLALGSVVSTVQRLRACRGAVHRELGGVTAYYGTGQALACVVIDVLAGLQVTLNSASLVARVPSEAEDWLCRHTEVHKLELIYTHAADPGSADLGLILRAQRAGDIVLSRLLFLICEWAESSWDRILGEEWSRFLRARGARTTTAPDPAGNHGERSRARQGCTPIVRPGQRPNQPQMPAASQAESASSILVTRSAGSPRSVA
jgi:hypothetical protein